MKLNNSKILTVYNSIVIAMTISLAASPLLLAWLTINGRLGDRMYGDLLMYLLSFPLSLARIPTDSWLYPVSDYLMMAWAGVLQAGIVGWLLRSTYRHRPSILSLWLAAFATMLTVVSGFIILTDQWDPRRIYGIPLLVCGAIQATTLFLLVLHRRRSNVPR